MSLSCDKSSERSDSADPIRRKILLGAVGITALLEMFGVKGLVSEVFAKEAVENLTDKQRIAKIEEIETEFSRLGKRVLPQLNKFVKNEKIRVMIRKAFEVFESNKTNLTRKSWDREVIPYGEENGFFYVFDDMNGRSSMFNGVYRTLKLRPDFNPASIGGLSFLAHELVHVVRDNHYRRTVPEHIYRTYWSGDFVAVPSEEAEAIAVQLEILNVATGGRPDSVKTGSDKADKFLIEMAEHYFNKDWNSFMFFVEKWYREKGARIFNADLTPAE